MCDTIMHGIIPVLMQGGITHNPACRSRFEDKHTHMGIIDRTTTTAAAAAAMDACFGITNHRYTKTQTHIDVERDERGSGKGEAGRGDGVRGSERGL